MDAIKFVKTLQRKFKDKNRDEIIIRTTDDTNYLVDLIEKWAKEHPAKTRQNVFLEQWPEAEIDESGCLMLCPTTVSADQRNRHEDCTTLKCTDCRREFWMQEVE